MPNFIIITGIMVSCIGKTAVRLEEIMVKSMPFRANSTLSVTTKNGKIDIQSWDKEELKIEATKNVIGYSKEKASELLKKIKIDISENKEGVSIETKLPITKKGNIWVDYKIYLPYESNLTAKSTNGEISIDSVKGEIKAETTNGSVHFKKVAGNKIEAETMNGSVLFKKVAGNKIEAETENGSIECELDTLFEPYVVSLQTMNGYIELQIPDKLSPSIYAECTNGNIDSDFPIFTKKSVLKGESRIVLETLNGNISITKNP